MIDRITRMLVEHHAGKIEASPGLIEDITLFEINTNYIAVFDKGIEDNICRKKLIEYLELKGKWKALPEVLRSMYPEDMSIEVAKPDLLALPDFKYRYDLGYFHFSSDSKRCIDLAESLTLNKDEYIDRDFFYFFFCYRLHSRQLERIIDFLSYVCKFHFDGNVNDFIYAISNIVVTKYKKLVGPERIRILNDLVSLARQQVTTTSSLTNEVKKDPQKADKILTVRQYALLHYYLQECNEEQRFENTGKTKKQCCKEISVKYSISQHKFYRFYNEVSKGPANRVKSIADLNCVLNFLPINSAARRLIQDEIKIYKTN